MGTPEFAVEPLKAIISAGHNVVAVVTIPDKPMGRGQKMQSSAVKQFALEQNIPVLQPAKLKDEEFLSQLKALNPDLSIVVAFRMLPEVVWSMPRMGTFNLHASLLPNYRGAAPINWAIINGEKKSGVTTFLLDKEIDTGSVILQQEVEIAPTDNAGLLHDKLMYAGAPLVVKTIEMLCSGEAQLTKQSQMIDSECKLKSAPKIFKETCQINWNNPIGTIHNQIRGLSPYPAAITNMQILRNGKNESISLKIFRSNIEEATHTLPFGKIVTDNKKILKVACINGFIVIEQLQQSGKKAMQIDDFLRGLQNTELLLMSNELTITQ